MNPNSPRTRANDTSPLCGWAIGLDARLVHYHWFWSVIHGREEEWDDLWHMTYLHEHANAGIWLRHRDRHPDLTDEEVLAYTLGVWHRLSLAIGVPLSDPNDLGDDLA